MSSLATNVAEGHGLRVIRTDPRCLIVEWEGLEPQTFLFRSDAHHDNMQCNQEMEMRHLRQAREKGAAILDFGDLFCLMEGKFDGRKAPTHARPEYLGKNYYDAVMDTAVRRYRPYAHHWISMSPGNHETAFTKRNETDPTANLVNRINDKEGSAIERMPYSGWIIFRARDGKRIYRTFRVWYTHGYGGGGPVTKGTIQANRRAVSAGSADMIVSGHIHERWILWYRHDRCSAVGRTYLEEQVHLCLPTYKEEYTQGEGYHIEGGRPPKPLGAFWVTLEPKEVVNGTKKKILEPIIWPAK